MRFRRLHHLLSIVLAALCVVSPLLAQVGQRPLKILLTNDDGFDSAGLKTMRSALMAAGHQVTVVAPAVNMSSTGMSMTSGAVKYEGKGEGVWAVYGTPADAAMIGLVHILRDTPQDLVVSGTNAGQNLGTNANTSGTVSAAIAATRQGVPAIATSAGIGPESATAYEVAASLVVQMIRALYSAPGSGIADRQVINMNVPAVPPGRLLGIRWAPLSRAGGFTRVFTPTANANEVQSRLTVSKVPPDEKDTDVALFSQGYVTLTLLDGDLGAPASANAALTSRLAKLELPVVR